MKQLPTNKSIGDIAIIGMAGRFPGARDVSAFWKNLKAGVESVSFFSEEELAAAGVDPQLLKNPNYVKANPTLEDIDKFDAEFFGYSPREAAVMDPQQRLFLETAWAALEDAGYDSERHDGAIGVYGGSYFDTYLLANLCTNRQRVKNLLSQSEPGIYQTYLGNDKDYLTTRVAYKMNLRGPAVTVLTACSTSLVAICQACQSLLYYQSDIALAGGVTVTVPQKKGYLYQDGGMLSADGHCRAFDERAQGTIFGSGVGVVTLKRLAEAVADGDHIYAVIKGSALNNDGAVKVSFTAPSVDGQAEVVALAQALAGVSADTINYIEAHGTGTPLGDPIEIAALTQAFQQSTNKLGFCGIGSLKSNIGHLDAAAGVASVIKTALALKHRLIPPTLHFTKPNPKIHFADSPFYVVSKPTEWNANGAPRRAGVSGFGVGGTNAHVVLEEAPLVEPTTPKRAAQLLTLSAKTPAALDRATAALASHLKTHPELNLADVAYTLQVGRRAMPHRRSLVCRDATDAIVQLEKSDPKKVFTQHQERRDAPVAFMFPGQGAQFVNMGRELYQSETLFREALDYCAEFLKPKLGLDLRDALASEELLVQTRITQPALFVIEYALAQLWMSWGIRPAAMIGHSVGEYVAGCLAGVFSLDDALTLVAERARLVQQQPRGAMLAVRLPENELRPFCNGHLSIAAVNAPALCVVSGPFDAIEEAERQFKDTGVASVRLQTSHAFHSAMMEPVVAQFAEVLRKVHLNEPQIPFVSNVTAQWVTPSQATDPQYWAGHVRQPVRFADGIIQLLHDPNTVLLEVGPGLTLTTLTRQHPQRKHDQTVLHSLSKGEELNSVLTAAGRLWLAGATLDSNAFFANESRRRVSLPTYPFERVRHWVEAERELTIPSCHPERSEGSPLFENTTEMLRSAQHDKVKKPTRTDEIKSLLSQLSGKDYSDAGDDVTFIELGFESLFLTQVSLAIAKQFGVQVAFRQLMGDINTISLLAAHLEKSALPSNTSLTPTVTATVAPQSSPLTDAQRELWLAAAMGDAASCAFNQSCALHLRGELRREILESALQELAARHDGLRVTFAPAGASQNAAPNVTIPFTYSNLAGRETELDKLLATEAAQPFDLERGPLLRARLIKLAAQHHVVLFTAHHIVCDGRSLALLLHEWGELYSAKCCGQQGALPPARSLLAYAVEESRTANSPQLAASETYWLQQYTERPEPLELPADFSRPAQKSFRGGLVSVALPPALGHELKRAGSRRGCTLFTTLLAAYYVFLHRMTGQDDIVVGVPMATTGSESSERLVGHTVNFLAVRRKIAAQSAWEEHLAAVKQSVIEAYEHRLFSYVSLVEKLALARETSRIPLAAVSFNLATKRQPLSFTSLEANTDANPHSFTNLDLTFDFNQDGDALHLDCVFNADLLTPETVRRWIGHFKTLLEAIADETSATIDELPLLSDAERQQLLVEWNDTSEAIPQKCVHDLFEEQARQSPDAVAVVFEGTQLTYRELNEQADRLAAHLRKAGVGPEKIVGLHVERSLEMMVGLLGVLKAGGTYLPLDPMFPAQRLEFMQEDALPLVVLTREKIQSALRDSVTAPQAPVSRPTPENLAYVLYTSGSTGKPKGVQIAHRSVVNFLESIRREPGLTASDTVLAITTLSFDIAALELFLPLVCGARVVIANRETAADGELLAKLIANSNPTVMQATPATWRMLLAAGWQGNPQLKILCGGEALPADLAEQLLKRSREVWNMYGPTETTIWSAVQRVTQAQPIVIGRPMVNTEFFVLDPQLQPVPVGVAGELLIGGEGLARGYLNRSELTAKKFIHHPFHENPETRLYRTGDRVRYLADGTLAFLGRMDNQVKLRGFRIELGEIEAVLRAVDGVRDAVAVLREDTHGDQRLVAYLLKNDLLPKAEDLRAAAQAKLPEYMIPTAFVTLDKFPLTPNGKVDRRALPAPEKVDQRPDRTYEAPRTEVEATLAELWRTLLRVKRVGLHDNFFELGGHSLLAIQTLSRVRDAFHVQVPLRALFEHPTLAGLAEQVRQLQGTTGQALQSAPLTDSQRELWLAAAMGDAASCAFNQSCALHLRGELRREFLEGALQELVARHDGLRVTFAPAGASLSAAPRTTISLAYSDLTGGETELDKLLAAEAAQPFDLERGPLLRTRLIKLAAQHHVVLFTAHHIVCDVRSLTLLLHEWGALYSAKCSGESGALPPARSLLAHALEEATTADNPRRAQCEAYWLKQYAKQPEPLELPADFSRPSQRSFRGGLVSAYLPPALGRELKRAGDRYGCTLFATLLAAYYVFLHRMTGQEDIVVGVPMATSGSEHDEPLVGHTVNFMAVRRRIAAQSAWKEHLAAVEQSVTEAYEHRLFSYVSLVEKLPMARETSHIPLAAVSFKLTTKRQPLSFAGLEATTESNPYNFTNLDLTFDFKQDGDALHLDCVFNADLLTHETARRWVGHFQTLLEAIAAETPVTIDKLPLLSQAERQQLLVEWNNPSAESPRGLCVHQLFETEAKRTPDAIAVVFETELLTYGELNRRANQVANHLRTLGVGPDVLVGICLERSVEMVIGLLGILKAGGAFVTLDPAYPKERLAFMLKDAQMPVLLTQQRLVAGLPTHDAKVVCLDSGCEIFSRESGENPVSSTLPEHLAYVIYTSGSTGQPKGVLVSHGAIAEHSRNVQRLYELDSRDVVLQFASLSFDVSLEEILPTLTAGARLVIMGTNLWQPLELHQKISEFGLTVLNLPTAYWQELAREWANIPELLPNIQPRLFIVGGDTMSPDVLKLWQRTAAGSIRLINAYGPTETTITATVFEIVPRSSGDTTDQRVPIGRPLANRAIYILDQHGNSVPIGVIGHVYIGGDSVARGYLNRPELTAEKFVADPFSSMHGATMYKTGDLARYRSDGNIEFLGRADHQVKVRGYRIELGEIEAVLRAQDGVRDAVVLLREDAPGDQRLVAYLLKNEHPTPKVENLRAAIHAKLPEFMTPAAFVTLDQFPLTPNGKLDRRALPAPDESNWLNDRNYEAPHTEVEETLAELWRTLLRVKRVGRHDNFFELGGHSLLAVKLMARARDAFRVPVALRVLFEHPTLAQLSEQVSQLQGTTAQSSQSTIQRIPLDKPLPLSFAQERLWFFDRLRPQSALYNVPLAIRLRGAVNGEMLQRALSEIVRRHTALRSTYIVDDGIPLQVIGETSTVELPLLDLSALPHAQRETQARRVMTEEARTPFDLTRDLALRGRLVRLAQDEHLFLLTLHHIASDGWSFDLLFRELSALYKAFADGQPSPLPELPFQYAEFANWHRRWLGGNLKQHQLDYWKTQLKGTTGIVELPADRARPTKQLFRGATRRMELPLHLHRELTALSRAENATLHMTLLAAFITLLQRLTRQDDIVVASPVTGRDRSDTQGLIGFFVNTVLIRVPFSDALEFRQLLRQVRETALSAYVNADLPFERVVALMRKELGVTATPLGNIMFALEHPVLNSLHLKDVQATNETVTTATSKFDITFVIEEHGDKLTANLEYDTDLFDEPRMDRLLQHYQLLLEAILKNPDERVTQLPSSPDATPQPQAISGKAEKHTHANTPTVCEMFGLRAAQTPNAVAVVDGNKQWTYQELNSRANRLARHLLTRGARVGDCVGVAHERSVEMIVTWLAILKTGAAYVPLDSTYPSERIEFMLRDCGARLVVGKGDALKQIAASGVAVLDVETEHEEILRREDGNPKATIEGNSRAYVMYTSGSTGKPKGVVIPHRAILRLVVDTDYVRLTPSDVVAQASNASFDAATFEVWGALLNGARVVIVPRETLVTPAELKREIAESRITAMFVTTALFNQISRESPALFQPLRHLLFGGEAVNPSCVADIMRAGKPQRLLHVYGPTETTTFATWYEVTGRELEIGTVPIGRPIANAEALVLDEQRQPVPVGAVGELYIGGSGLADGYWNRPELTAEKFVPHPFGTNGDRVYRTGDLVRQLPDGNLLFVGRSDNQIKLRGFRIELGEIEAALSRHDGVQQCVVTVHNDALRGSALTAYYVARPGKRAGKSELRRHLQGILPEHMTPSFFVELTAMPLTPNGKVDRRALPAPEPTRTDAGEHIAPRNDVEQRLAAIWENVLGVEGVGVTDQFFALGGHSLLGVKLMGRIETAFGRKLPLATLFEAQTIEQLARIVSGAVEPQKWSALVELEGGRRENPFFWIHSLGGDGGGAFQYYRPLAKLLGHRGASYGIRAPEKPYDCLETMATFYVEQMQAFQPHGPYFLGGFCFGGVVAYEIARQLRKSGEEVRLVALLESSPPQRPKPTIQRLANSWYPSLREFAQLPRGQRVAFIRYKGKRLRARLRSGLARCGVVSVESVLEDAIDLSRYPRDYIQAAETHWLALSRYVPQIYDGPLLLVRQHATTDESLDYGWQALTTGAVTVVEAPGTHESILQEPNVAVVADAVARYLEKTTEEPHRIEVAA